MALDLEYLAVAAWHARDRAFIYGSTKVGCAILSDTGEVFTGCNVEHRFRSHDVHAEVNAITTMVAAGYVRLTAVVIAADREYFTPCGACMDWIMQFGGSAAIVAFQNQPAGELHTFSAEELMPYYPR